MNKRIAVLMTCYNRVDTTLACLQRLFAQDMPNGYLFDVWLVDDASPDKTGEKIKATFPSVNVIPGTGKLFWCKGMRLAWDKASEANDYDFYLWLNDDVMLDEGALRITIEDYEVLTNRGSRVIVGSFWESEERTKISYTVECTEPGVLCPNGKFPQEGRYWTPGNFIFVPRDVYEKIGKISNKYHHGCGDADYMIRLSAARIPFFCPTKALGICPLNNRAFRPLKELSLTQRISLLWRPNGLHLGDTFWFRYAQKRSIFRALISVVHVVFVAVFAKGNVRR